jgi:hypothetical protein
MRRLYALVLFACGGRTELGTTIVEQGDAACRAPVVLQIPATVAWTDTGIDVREGSRLTINATGKVVYGTMSTQVTDANGGNFDGQKFFPGAVLPNTIIVSLIGKTGGTTALDTGTPLPVGKPGSGPGFVGVATDVVVGRTGRLFLGFNDQRANFGDNSGAFTVTISTGC